jgi:AcrR family transcriptional regulator
MNATPRGETAQRRRESADATSGQRQVRRVQIQLSLLSIIQSTGKTLGEVQLSEIAAGVGSKGISPANIYTYYATKEEILRDAVDAWLTQRMTTIDLRFRRTESFGDYVGRIVEAAVSPWEENATVLRLAAGLPACGPEYQRWWQGLLDPWVTAFCSAVDEARASAELPMAPGDVRMLGNVGAWAVAGSCQQVMTTPEGYQDRHLLQQTLTLTLRRMMGDTG